MTLAPTPVTDCDVADTVVVFAYGPEIPNDGVAVAGGLSEELKANIKQALLDFAATEEGAAVARRDLQHHRIRRAQPGFAADHPRRGRYPRLRLLALKT